MTSIAPTNLRPLSKDHSELLNIIRALSAFFILFAHITLIYFLPRYGSHSNFFFYSDAFMQYPLMALIVLSGFCITYDSLNLMQRNNHQLPVKHFFFKRLTRLYPALLFSLILTLIAFLILTHGCFTCTYHFKPTPLKVYGLNAIHIDFKHFFAPLLFLHGLFIGKYPPTMNLPLWTLSYEFWYYILFVFIMLMITKRYRKTASTLTTLLLAYMVLTLHFQFLLIALAWLAGALLAYSYSSNKLFSNGAKHIIFLLLMLILVIFTATYFSRGRSIFLPINNLGYIIQASTGLILALLFALILCFNIPIKNVFAHKLAGHAKSSYTLYVLHYPLLLLSFHFTWKYVRQWPTLFIVFVIIAYSLVIIYLCKKCAIVLENKTLYRNLLSKVFSKKNMLL